MNLRTIYCPNRNCSAYGNRGLGKNLIFYGSQRLNRRLYCTRCSRAFSSRIKTAYYKVETEEQIFTIAMRALAEGNSLRGTGRIVGVDKDTVCAWLDRSGSHCRSAMLYLLDNLHITECQLDELWGFVYKKEYWLTEIEQVIGHYGDAWVWIAFAPEWRLVAAFVVGKRTQENADLLLRRFQSVTCGHIPFFTSDQLPQYTNALLNVYGLPEVVLHLPGKPGPKPQPRRLPPSDLVYAQVVKERDNGRLTGVTNRLVFGTETQLQDCLDRSSVSSVVNTSFIERNNLTVRQSTRRLSRKVLAFSKDRNWLEKHLWLSFAYYHLVRPHDSLAQILDIPMTTNGNGSLRKRVPVTPAMAAGITHHVWSMDELLSFRPPLLFAD